MDTFLFFFNYALLLLFGICLSAAFVGIRFSRQNVFVFSALFVLSGLVQLLLFFIVGEQIVWKLYPLIVHVPTLLVLCLHFRKRLPAAIAALTAAYLCCQPAKWFGLFTESLSGNQTVGLIFRIAVLLILGFLAITRLAAYISALYSKDTKNVWIFGIVPMVYYIFDYTTGIYGDLWVKNSQIVFEFTPFILCIVHLIFCTVYYREYEQKAEAKRKEQMIRMLIEQQSRELEAMKRSEQEIRMVRHDIRLLMNNLSVCIDENDHETARKLISGYGARVDATAIKRYCENDAVNYVLASYETRCRELNVNFIINVNMGAMLLDEAELISILSNALDNALNAQQDLPADMRSIRLMMKTSVEKLLISVKNPYKTAPVFVDGLPVSSKPGHGYGVQSIRYMTEQLGGNCLFSLKDGMFVLQIVL